MARERPRAPILGMTPRRETARRLALVWGVNRCVCDDVADVDAHDRARRRDAPRSCSSRKPGQTIVIAAGMPFGTPGTTNLLRIAQID